MLTQCPECETTFRITGAILRAANGQVRCGRCRTQFDATERLLDDEGEPLSRIDQATLNDDFLAPEPEPEPQNIIVEEPPAQEEITLEGKRIEITGTYRVLNEDAARGSSPHDHVIEQRYVMESDVSEESDAVDEFDRQHLSTSELRARRIAEEDEAMLRVASGAPPDERSVQQAQESDIEPDPTLREEPFSPPPPPDIELFGAAPPKTRVGLLWKVALVPLALLLVAQFIHHERADLARHASLGPPLLKVYSALGLSVDPNWNVREYDLKQRGVIADPAAPGTLTVRASITNLAQYPQPYPLLKLVLEDRWGNAVRSRAFKPQEYAVIADANALMSPGQRAEARVAIADPGREAEGFRFDLCLPRASGVVCAEESPAN